MAAEETYRKILEYLKKEVSVNTFRLARELGIDRSKLLNLVKKLEEKEAVEVAHGTIKFLKFVAEEKKTEKPVTRPSKARATQLPKIKRTEAKPLSELKEKLLKLESKIKELEKKASAPPKIIKKTIIKKVPVPSAPAPPLKKKKKKRKAKYKKKIKKEKKPKKVQEKSKTRFKFLKSIKQLKKPEFVKK